MTRRHFLEDVQQFEKAILGRSSRGRSEATAKVAEDDSEEDKGSDSEDKDEDEGEAPKKRPVSPIMSSFVVSRPLWFTKHVQTNARKSIMAFLQDQSDEEWIKLYFVIHSLMNGLVPIIYLP